MKIIGLLGGMSWESTVPYYRIVNETVKARLGGLHSAKVVLLCTNTMHKIADRIESAVRIPLLHIADPTAHAIQAAGFSKVGLLGTRFTMEQDFYKERLAQKHGLQVLVPSPSERDVVHRIIYQELCLGRVLPESRLRYRETMAALAERGAQALILGCTEISLLVGPADTSVPMFDTTAIYARSAAFASPPPHRSPGLDINANHIRT